MSKEAYYFSHDEGARNDPKLIKVLMRLGQAGKGIYWDLIEMLYEQEGYLNIDECESYAFALRTECDVLKSLINDFELFENNGVTFWSESVLRRLTLRKSKSIKASESASKRWKDANAMRTHSEGNAIKVKESKEDNTNSIVVRKQKFAATLTQFVSVYGKDTVNAFYKYWTEPNKSNTKFKQEMQKTWDTKRRLETWANNDFNKKVIPMVKGAIDQSQNVNLFK